jgi:hypothetical protein
LAKHPYSFGFIPWLKRLHPRKIVMTAGFTAGAI